MKLYANVMNRLIKDKELDGIDKKLMVGMQFIARNGIVREWSMRKLAKLCRYNKDTILTHIQKLEQRGYLSVVKKYRYSLTLGRVIVAENEYKLNMDCGEDSYTLIPRSILRKKVSPSCFSVMLFLYLCAGRDGRAYPSVQYIAGTRKDGIGGCGVSERSVCRALKDLERIRFFIRVRCKTRNGDYSCNSYLLTEMIGKKIRRIQVEKELLTGDLFGDPDAGETSCPSSTLSGGTAKNGTLGYNNKITKGFTGLKGEKGVDEFGDLYNSWMKNLFSDPFFFDGTGVKVSACGEPDLTG